MTVRRPSELNTLTLVNSHIHELYEAAADIYQVWDLRVNGRDLTPSAADMDTIPFARVRYLRLHLDFTHIWDVQELRSQLPQLARFIEKFSILVNLELNIIVNFDCHHEGPNLPRYTVFDFAKSFRYCKSFASCRRSYAAVRWNRDARHHALVMFSSSLRKRTPRGWRLDPVTLKRHSHEDETVVEAKRLGMEAERDCLKKAELLHEAFRELRRITVYDDRRGYAKWLQ